MISFTCEISKTKQKNAKLVDIENRLIVARCRGWARAKWVKGIKCINFQVIK